jgi:hypothetical protein
MMRAIIAKLAIREFWMFTIAGLGMLTLAIVAVQVAYGGMPRNAEAILSAIVTGIVLTIRDVITAIRALWRISQEHIEAEPGEQLQ